MRACHVAFFVFMFLLLIFSFFFLIFLRNAKLCPFKTHMLMNLKYKFCLQIVSIYFFTS